MTSVEQKVANDKLRRKNLLNRIKNMNLKCEDIQVDTHRLIGCIYFTSDKDRKQFLKDWNHRSIKGINTMELNKVFDFVLNIGLRNESDEE